MDLIERKLRRLRGWFIAWFAVEAFIGIVVSVTVLDGLHRVGLPGLGGGMDALSLGVVPSLFILAILMGLALWVFQALLQLQNWARLVLLVLGWFSVAEAVTSVLATGGLGMLRGCLPGIDLAGLALVSIITNALKLVFWSYVIATLQFDPGVREAFHGTACGSPGLRRPSPVR